MPAWEVRALWNDKQIQGYRDYVAAEGPKRSGVQRCTCEDLALRLVIEYAAKKNLPLQIVNGAHSKGLRPDRFDSLDAFLEPVLTTTGASDLLNKKMAKYVSGAKVADSASLQLAKPGDLIILYNGGHVQVVTDANGITITISQGNFRPSNEQCSVSLIWSDQNNPTDSCYIGEIVGQFNYSLDPKTNTWLYSRDGSNLFANDHGELAIWDFSAWNDLVIEHTVASGEDLTKIGQKYFKDGTARKRIYETNRTTIGSNENHIRAGQKLYIWK